MHVIQVLWEVVVSVFKPLGLDDKLDAVVGWLGDAGHRKIVIASGIFFFAFVVLIIYACSGIPDVSRRSWVYEEATGRLNALGWSRVDDETIRARVYTCGTCDDGERLIGYLMRGEKVKRVEDGHWVDSNSPEGQTVIASVDELCHDHPEGLKSCYP